MQVYVALSSLSVLAGCRWLAALLLQPPRPEVAVAVRSINAHLQGKLQAFTLAVPVQQGVAGPSSGQHAWACRVQLRQM